MAAEASDRWRRIQLGVQVDSVLGAEWKEVQFANASRLDGEVEAVDDIHFTRGWPRAISATITALR